MAVLLESEGDCSPGSCLQSRATVCLLSLPLCVLADLISWKDGGLVSSPIRWDQVGHGVVVEPRRRAKYVAPWVTRRANKGSIGSNHHELLNPRVGIDCGENEQQQLPAALGKRSHSISGLSVFLKVAGGIRIARRPAEWDKIYVAFCCKSV